MAARTLDIHIKAKDLYSRELNKSQTKFQAASENIRQNFVANFARAAGAVIAFKQAFDIAKEAAKFDQQQQAFSNLAASHGQNSADMIRSLKAVSAQTISTAGIMEAAGNAMVLGIPADKLSEMMEIARASARITGQSVQKSFEDIALGVGRGSKMILDNLGIMIDSEAAYSDYAAALGRTSDSLTDAEKKQAFMNATLKAGQDIIKRVGVQGITASEAMEAFSAKIEDVKIFFGKLVISISSGLSAIAFGFSAMIAETLSIITTGWAEITKLMAELPLIGDKVKPVSKAVREFSEDQRRASMIAKSMAANSLEVAMSIWKEKTAIEGVTKARTEAEVIAPASPEEDPQTQAIIMRMQFRDQEITQMIALTDAMAFHAERGVAISEQMAAGIVVANQRIAWSNEARTSLVSKANAEMQNSMLGLIETGKFSVGAFAKIMAQQVKIELAGIAAKASVRALYETGLGFATMWTNPAESAGHFTAAGQLAGVAAASLAAGAAVNAVAGGTAQQPGAGEPGGEPIQTEEVGAGELLADGAAGTRPRQVQEIHIHTDGIISPETIDKALEDVIFPGMDRAADRNIKINGNLIEAV